MQEPVMSETPSTPPDVLARALQPLHPSARTVWMIKMVLFGAVLILLALAYDLTSFFRDDGLL
ncbi:MAG: hypothetical protein HKN13_02450, partial [Rhodothermales bacterium]|nr:hypothetical protein [Rhodothermales bacterium]